MPRWLRWWLTASLALFWAAVLLVGVPFALSRAVNSGEPAFSDEQSRYLKEAYPGGVFISSSQYRWCDGRVFVYFDSRGDSFNYSQSCWRIER